MNGALKQRSHHILPVIHNSLTRKWNPIQQIMPHHTISIDLNLDLVINRTRIAVVTPLHRGGSRRDIRTARDSMLIQKGIIIRMSTVLHATEILDRNQDLLTNPIRIAVVTPLHLGGRHPDIPVARDSMLIQKGIIIRMSTVLHATEILDRNQDLFTNPIRIAVVTPLHLGGRRHRDIPAAMVIITTWSRILIIQNSCRLKVIESGTQNTHSIHIQRLGRRPRTAVGSLNK